jgi:uncharacterized protein (DUF58 family)
MVVVAVLLAVGGVTFSRIELVYLATVLVLAVALSWLSVAFARAPRRVVRIPAADIVAAGDPLRILTRVDTRTGFDDARELVSPGLALVETRRDDAGLTSVVVPARRGVHRVGPLRLERAAPFGAALRRLAAGGSIDVVAVPPIVPLVSLRSAGAAGDDALRPGPQGQGADNLIPRPYAPGDSIRRVHWRASAHHGDLMVREEEREQTAAATVVIDTDPAIWADDDAFDHALSALVSIAARLRADGFRVFVRTTGGSAIGDVATPSDLARLLVACAHLEPSAAPVARMADTGVVVVVGRASWAPTTPSPHVLLTPVPVASPGWRQAPLGDDIADAWASAISGAPR